MKTLASLGLLFITAATLNAAEPLLLRGETLPVLAAPTLKEALAPEWKIAHGTYEPKDGVLVCAEKPENKHVAVLWHEVAWNTGVIECEFRFDGARVLILGCDGKLPTGLAHVGRVVISPKQISLAEDSIKPSHTLAKQTADLASGQWHKLRFEWQGDEIAVRVNDVTVRTKHDYLRTEKTRSWIAVGGNSLSIRALKISGKP